jgi:uncharacterized membrane protein YecN with MAPEG domain
VKLFLRVLLLWAQLTGAVLSFAMVLYGFGYLVSRITEPWVGLLVTFVSFASLVLAVSFCLLEDE